MAIKVGNVVQSKAGTITYASPGTTVAKVVFTLPANAMVIGVRVFGTASDDTGTATLTFKNIPFSTGTPATFATVDVKTAISTVTGLFAVSSYTGIAFARQAEPQHVSVTYTGQNSNAAAGSWTFAVEYL